MKKLEGAELEIYQILVNDVKQRKNDLAQRQLELSRADDRLRAYIDMANPDSERYAFDVEMAAFIEDVDSQAAVPASGSAG